MTTSAPFADHRTATHLTPGPSVDAYQPDADEFLYSGACEWRYGCMDDAEPGEFYCAAHTPDPAFED